ncbi:MAG: T9SS type A sorting domain-containing protein, partial [Fibromonadales bacterium]|nr:T9SS type A sorting domain-containing protein [Fibromonadales bacterium]
ILNRENPKIGGIGVQTVAQIYNLKGNLIMTQTIMPNETLSLSHLPKGVYLVNIGGKVYRFAH